MRIPSDEIAWLGDAVPPRLREVVLDCARGNLPANVGLMHVFMAARNAEAAEQILTSALRCAELAGMQHAAARLRTMVGLWRQTPNAYEVVRAVLEVEQRGSDQAEWGSVFDRAAEISPEAGVALYSLGSASLLDAATNEIVERMRAWSLLGEQRTILEIGCGIGRCLDRLAREMRLAVGIDVSQRMLDLARARCAGVERVALVRSSGRDLAAFRDASFDVVLAVDSFPYLVRSRLAERHVHEASRVLTPGGSLLILNYSYRDDSEADRTDLARFAADTRLQICRNGTREFAFWDGIAFLLRRQGGEQHPPKLPNAAGVAVPEGRS